MNFLKKHAPISFYIFRLSFLPIFLEPTWFNYTTEVVVGVKKKLCMHWDFYEFCVAWLLWTLCHVGYSMSVHPLLFMFFLNIEWQDADEVLCHAPM